MLINAAPMAMILLTAQQVVPQLQLYVKTADYDDQSYAEDGDCYEHCFCCYWLWWSLLLLWLWLLFLMLSLSL